MSETNYEPSSAKRSVFNRLAMFLTDQQLSVNHVFVGGLVFAAIQEGRYIGAILVFAIGTIYCSMINKLAQANRT